MASEIAENNKYSDLSMLLRKSVLKFHSDLKNVVKQSKSTDHPHLLDRIILELANRIYVLKFNVRF
jgi:hypothetical protein